MTTDNQSNKLFCPSCKVRLTEPMSTCPLCQKKLSDEKQLVPQGFPGYAYRQKKYYRRKRIIAVTASLLILFSVLLNTYVFTGRPWSAVAVAGILYAWILGFISFKRNIHLGLKMTLHAIALPLLLVLIDAYVEGELTSLRVTWAISYTLPIVLGAMMLAIYIVMLGKRQTRRDFLIYQLALSVIGLSPLVFVLTDLADPKFPSLLTSVLAYLSLIGLIVFAKRRLRSLFGRKFHL